MFPSTPAYEFVDRAVPDDGTTEAKERFRELRADPPTEGNAADVTIGRIDVDTVDALSYTFDMGDSREHCVELRETRKGTLDGDPVVVDEQGDVPPQYPDHDE